MDQRRSILVFYLGEYQYALPLSSVVRVVNAVAVTPLPGAPATIQGIIDVRGTVLPVFNMRRRFQLPERDVAIDDHFLIASTALRTVALAIDEAQGVIELHDAQIIAPKNIAPGLEHISGVTQLPDGLVLIHDIETFLSLDEAAMLDAALKL